MRTTRRLSAAAVALGVVACVAMAFGPPVYRGVPTGVQSEGASRGSNEVAVVRGACCRTDGTCVVTTSGLCASVGGTYQGNNTTCRGRNCPASIVLGACCLRNAQGNAYCYETGEVNCEVQGGIYVGDGTLCVSGSCIDPNDPTGACCVGFFNPVCEDVSEAECNLYGGFYQGNGTSCANTYCGFDF